MENTLLDILKSQGIPTLILVVFLIIICRYVLPEWKRQAVKREEQEAARNTVLGDHMDKLTKVIHETNQEHRQERAEINAAHARERKEQEERHREDRREERKVFSDMANSINANLRSLGREMGRNTAITLASAMEGGSDKQRIKDRADKLQAGDMGEIESIQERMKR